MAEPNEAKVAVVRAENRRGAVAEALSLLGDHRLGSLSSDAVVVPHLATSSRAGRSTHPDTLSAVVDLLLAAGARRITVAAASPLPGESGTPWFERLGYAGELWKRPVLFLALNSISQEFRNREHPGEYRFELPDRFPRSECRVSLAVANGPGLRGTGFGFAGLLNLLGPTDRARLEPFARAGGLFDRLLGRSTVLRESTEALARASELVAIAGEVRPTLSVIDTFANAGRSGPRAPRRAQGLVFAGTDPVAVDSVAAALLGANPRRIGYLALAQSAGLGLADLSRIEVVGDFSSRVLSAGGGIPGMHVRSRRTRAAQFSSRSR